MPPESMSFLYIYFFSHVRAIQKVCLRGIWHTDILSTTKWFYHLASPNVTLDAYNYHSTDDWCEMRPNLQLPNAHAKEVKVIQTLSLSHICSLGKLKLATESLVLSHNSNSFHRSYPEQPRKYNHAACAWFIWYLKKIIWCLIRGWEWRK